MSADPSASIWEVTRMILDSPGTSPSMIAHAHGFSAVEVAELLPIFLDNLRADFASADGPAPALVPPAPQPGETPEEHADRYLSELAQSEHLDVVGYDTLGATDGDLDGDLDGGLDDGPDGDLDGGLDGDLGGDLDGDVDGDLDADLHQDPIFLDTAPAETSTYETVELDDGADHAGAVDQPAPDLHDVDPMHGLAEDDPFAASAASEVATPDVPDDGAAAVEDGHGEPFAMG